MADDITAEQWWSAMLTGKNLHVPVKQLRHAFRMLPSENRCVFCNSPFDGFSAPVIKKLGRGPSRISKKFCTK
ncbi:MAG: hypothetical protein QF878_15490, partial [SAR202 cluster bacterium]|nr:hypothetical protein [SAR202 cluster bacterium]